MASATGAERVVRPTGLFGAPEKSTPVVCLLLTVITLALYNPVNRYPFVNYDDDRYVTANPHVREGLTWNTFTWALTSTEQANWHPLTWTSHALDWSLFRSNPTGHHFTSILLHTLNAILLFILLLRTTRRVAASFFVAGVFAVHPINVESVAWIAERKNVLCTTFFLLVLLAYAWYARTPDWKRYLCVAGMFGAGLAAKPMVITLPFVLLLWDYWPLERTGEPRSAATNRLPSQSWPRLFLEKVPLLVFSAVGAVITVRAQQIGGAMRSSTQFPLIVRLENATCSYAMYLWNILCPTHLAPMYPHPGNSLPGWQVALSAFVLIGITIVIFQLRSRRYLLVGWLWFLGTLVPMIGLVQVGEAAMADRYAYIPVIGILLLVAFGLTDLATAKQAGVAWQWGFTAALLIAFAAFTHRQIGYWDNSYDLWTHTLEVTRNNFVAEDNLGGALLDEGKPDEAFPHFEAAARINPSDAMSRTNLGVYLQSHGRINEAIAQYESVITMASDPGLLAQAHANLGAAQRTLGQDEAAHHSFDEALRLNPDQSTAWLGMGLLAQKQGDIGEAVRDLSRSAELHPSAATFLRLGRVLEEADRPTEALAAYEAAVKLDPGIAEAQQAINTLHVQPRGR